MEATAELQETKQKEGSVKSELPIAINIFYGGHKTGEDQRGLKKEFAKADVYVPEYPSWTPETLEIFQRVSEGSLEPDDAVKRLNPSSRKAKLADLRILYNSNKPIIFADVSATNPIFWENVDQLSRWAELTDAPALNTSFVEYLEHIRNAIKDLTQAQKERENYILLNLGPKIKELLKEHPELKNRERLNVLLNLGAAHTSVFRTLRENKQEVHRAFNNMPQIFSYTEEGIRSVLFNRDIGDELISKISLELLFRDELEQWASGKAKDSIGRNKIYRTVLSQISIKDTEDIFDRIRTGEDRKMAFDDLLEAKGFQKPKTRTDAKRVLVTA